MIVNNSAALEALDALPSYDSALSLKWNQKLREQGFSAQLVAEILTQSRLRAAAVKKFGADAAKYLYTQEALEQASRHELAEHHAAVFKAQQSSHCVVDLGCGIGADSIAFAKAGLKVIAIEMDPERAALATYNLRFFDRAQVICADANTFEIPDSADLWFDPARRASGKRLASPEDYSPPLTLAYEYAHVGFNVYMKLSPAMKHSDIPIGCQASWLSYEGDVCELTLGFHAFNNSRRSALLIADGVNHRASTDREFGDDPKMPVQEIGAYVYEADGALLRSGLLNQEAIKLGLWQIDPEISYLSSDEKIESVWFNCFQVQDVLPYKTKLLKQYLKQHDIGKLTIKKRGINETPEQIRQSLKPKGKKSATMIVTRARGQRIVIIC